MHQELDAENEPSSGSEQARRSASSSTASQDSQDWAPWLGKRLYVKIRKLSGCYFPEGMNDFALMQLERADGMDSEQRIRIQVYSKQLEVLASWTLDVLEICCAHTRSEAIICGRLDDDMADPLAVCALHSQKDVFLNSLSSLAPAVGVKPFWHEAYLPGVAGEPALFDLVPGDLLPAVVSVDPQTRFLGQQVDPPKKIKGCAENVSVLQLSLDADYKMTVWAGRRSVPVSVNGEEVTFIPNRLRADRKPTPLPAGSWEKACIEVLGHSIRARMKGGYVITPFTVP